MTYNPPYTLSSKMVNLISDISEELTNLKFISSSKTTPMLRKKNRIKTLAGTLEIVRDDFRIYQKYFEK